MQIEAKISEDELRGLIADTMAEKHPEFFPDGAVVSFIVTRGQREADTVSASVTPRRKAQPKD